MTSPGLPRPEFYPASARFRTKVEANRPRRSIVPRPPAKLGHVRCQSQAKRVSFRENQSDSETMSKLYDTSKSESYFRQVFEVQDKIGEGSFAEVYRARDKERGVYYAIKQSHQFRKNVDRIRQVEEVKKHELIPPHPNCVKYIGAWEEGERLYLQTELCAMSLAEHCEENHDVSEKLVWNYLVDLLRALKHLHDRDLVHLDVKPENILISSHGVLKLGDFGLVHDLHRSAKDLSPLDGDGKYLAPEVLNKEVYSKAADVFSLGITLLEVAVDLDVPSSGPLFLKLRNGQLPDELIEKTGLSDDLVELIRKMLKPSADERPSVDMLLFHPAVSKIASARERIVDFYDKYDLVKARAAAALHHIVKRLVLVFWAVWSWIVDPVALLNFGRGRFSRGNVGSDSDAGNSEWTTRDESSTGGGGDEPGQNGTPPNVRAACAQPSPVMKSHSELVREELRLFFSVLLAASFDTLVPAVIFYTFLCLYLYE